MCVRTRSQRNDYRLLRAWSNRYILIYTVGLCYIEDRKGTLFIITLNTHQQTVEIQIIREGTFY
jgi:hypothetical protein